MVKRWFTVGRMGSQARDDLVPALLAATGPRRTRTLSSATAHPEQIEAPEGNEDQGARGQSQQHDNCFQHRLTPLVSQKHARLSQFCHHSVAASAPTKPFSGATKTSGNKERLILLVTKQGRPTCNSSSISFGTSHGTDSWPRSVSRRRSNDRALRNDPRPG